MRWRIKPPRLWVFGDSGRGVVALEVRSSEERDVVHFRFVDEHRVRKASVKKFLRNFSRVP